MSKRFRKIEELYDKEKTYSLGEAIAILQKCPPVKFDQTVEVALKIGVDPKKSDQVVRGTVSLPNGTGKTLRVLVFARGEKVEEAKRTGADFVGNDDLIAKVLEGWTDYDAVIATPDMMRDVGRLGKVLGPRGLMPTPKAGTVTTDVARAISEVRAGKIEFKQDRHGVVNNGVGKVSFSSQSIEQNIRAFLQAVLRAKPAAAKGQYIRSMTISSTMGPGLKVDLREVEAA